MSHAKAIEVGDRFGRLVVREVIQLNYRKSVKCLCDCSCGKTRTVHGYKLKKGTAKSCGCAHVKHGLAKQDPLTVSSWEGMRNRCLNPKQKAFQKYGAAGVTICEFLAESPRNLVAVIGPRPSRQMSLDRFPVHDGNYECGQCPDCLARGAKRNIRWASYQQQAENRGKFNRPITAFGQTKLLSQWASDLGINFVSLWYRLERGWSAERAVSEKVARSAS